jgi:hypothetical protein
MPNQLFTCYIENPLIIISINSGSWGVMVVWLEIKTWVIGKSGTKRGGRGRGVAGFCGPCVYLGVLPPL